MYKELALSTLLVPVAAYVLPVHAVDYLSVAQARQALFPEATNFVDHALNFSSEQRRAIKKRAGTRQRSDQQPVWRAERNGEVLGWLLVDDVIGKHEFITYAVALSSQGEVIGIEILSYRETHGDQVREANWRKQFEGKGHDDSLKLGRDISNISGATLSCRNLTDGVRRLLVQWDMFLRNA